jgi:hypothetical protein
MNNIKCSVWTRVPLTTPKKKESRSQWPRGLRHELRSLERWDREFESHSRYGCLCVRLFCVCVVLCVGSGLAMDWSHVQGVLPKQKLRGLSPQSRTTPIERPPLVGEVSDNFSRWKVSRGQLNESPTVVNFGFLDQSHYFLEIAPQLSSRGWVDPVPHPLLLRKIW